MFGFGDKSDGQGVDEPDPDQEDQAKREAIEMSKFKVPEDKLMKKFKKKAKKIGKKPRDSKKLSTYDKFKVLWDNSTYTYLLLAAFLRIMGRYGIFIWGQKYFITKYPDKKDALSGVYSLILTFGSVPSEIFGGYLANQFNQKSQAANETKTED